MTSRVSRHMNTLGRMTSRRFTVSATNSAAGRAPCAMSLPTADGIGSNSGCPSHVLE